MAKVSFWNLNPGKEYYIKTHDTHLYFKGMIFDDYYTFREPIYYDIDINMRFRRTTTYYSFYKQDYYYYP